MSDQEYGTETLKRELGRLGYTFHFRPKEHPDDFDDHWEVKTPTDRQHGALETTESEACHAALEHALHDKRLTGAKMTAICYGRWGVIEIASSEEDGHLASLVTDDKARTEAEGDTLDQAINALWEAVCLQGEST